MVSSPEKENGSINVLYQYAIHIAFGVVIAQSFGITAKSLLPNEQLLSCDHILQLLAILMSYFIMITSWIGYYRSIKKNGYTETKLGTVRFGLDFVILFLYYYLITLIVDESLTPTLPVWIKTNYYYIFRLILPFIFITYFVWDIIKYLEYRHESKRELETRFLRTLITSIYLIIITLQSELYSILIPIINTDIYPLKYNGCIIWDHLFVISSIIIIVFYRTHKILSKRANK